MSKLGDERSMIDGVMDILRLPGNEYFFNGSTVLALHGIERERPMGDIDIFVTTALWFDLLERFGYTKTARVSAGTVAQEEGAWWLIVPKRDDPKRRTDPPILRGRLCGITVDIFFTWRKRNDHSDLDCAFYMANVEFIGGYPCAQLQFIMDWKLGAGRNKDLMDVIAIRNHLGMEAN
jgi:hypothetical protein